MADVLRRKVKVGNDVSSRDHVSHFPPSNFYTVRVVEFC